MTHRTGRKLMYILILSGGTLTFILALIFLESMKLALGLGVAVSSSGILTGVIFVRCPYCHAGLNLRGFSPDYCPNCGRKI